MRTRKLSENPTSINKEKAEDCTRRIPVNSQKNLVSVKCLSAILGPEMAAPILWAPGKCVLSAGKTSMSIKFLLLGGSFGFLGRECRFYFYGREDIPVNRCPVQ